MNFYLLEGGTIPLYQQINLINKAHIIITQMRANCRRWSQCCLLYCGNGQPDN